MKQQEHAYVEETYEMLNSTEEEYIYNFLHIKRISTVQSECLWDIPNALNT